MPDTKKLIYIARLVTEAKSVLGENNAIVRLAEEALEEPWACASKAEPSDCDWPACGCDHDANRVVDALMERGWLAPPSEIENRLRAVEDRLGQSEAKIGVAL